MINKIRNTGTGTLTLKASEREAIAGYLFLLPNFLGFLAFTLIPVIFSLVLSFVKWDILTPPVFVGISNFVNFLGFHKEAGGVVANDPLFWRCLWNTLFLMMIIPVQIMAALGLAVAMNQKIRNDEKENII